MFTELFKGFLTKVQREAAVQNPGGMLYILQKLEGDDVVWRKVARGGVAKDTLLSLKVV